MHDSGTPSTTGKAFLVNSASSRDTSISPVFCRSLKAFENVCLAADTLGVKSSPLRISALVSTFPDTYPPSI